MTLAELYEVYTENKANITFPDGEDFCGEDWGESGQGDYLLSEDEAFQKYKNNKVLSIGTGWGGGVLTVIIER